MDGRVRPEGIDLTFLNMVVEETFFRMLRNREFDASEMSMSSYVVSLCKPERPFVAIPVFPSRFFRHSCIYVNADAGIETPARPDRQAHRHARIPDDRAGLDPRHPVGTLRCAGGFGHLCHRRRGRAEPRREVEAGPAAEHPGRAHRPRPYIGADAGRRARSTRCTPRASPRPSTG